MPEKRCSLAASFFHTELPVNAALRQRANVDGKQVLSWPMVISKLG